MLTLKVRSFDIGMDKIIDMLLFNKVSQVQAQTFLVFFFNRNQRIRIHVSMSKCTKIKVNGPCFPPTGKNQNCHGILCPFFCVSDMPPD